MARNSSRKSTKKCGPRKHGRKAHMRGGKQNKATCVKNRKRQIKTKSGRRMRNLPGGGYNITTVRSQYGGDSLAVNWNDTRMPPPEFGTWTPNIVEINFGFDFNQPLADYMIPRSVKLIRLGDRYNQPIESRLLQRIDMLEIPDTYQFRFPPPERLKIRRYRAYTQEEEDVDFYAL